MARSRARFPRVAPNPRFPFGQDIDATDDPAAPACRTALPHPAKRCGLYVVECADCCMSVSVTTAGRHDDPRSVKMNCRVEA